MNTRIIAMILLIAVGADHARADGFAPWTRPGPQAATSAGPRAPVPPTGFAPWATTPRPAPGSAPLAADGQRSRFHGFGPWNGARA